MNFQQCTLIKNNPRICVPKSGHFVRSWSAPCKVDMERNIMTFKFGVMFIHGCVKNLQNQLIYRSFPLQKPSSSHVLLKISRRD